MFVRRYLHEGPNAKMHMVSECYVTWLLQELLQDLKLNQIQLIGSLNQGVKFMVLMATQNPENNR